MKHPILIVCAMAALTACTAKAPTGSDAGKVETAAKESGGTSSHPEKGKAGSNKGSVAYLTTEKFRQQIADYVANPRKWVYKGSRPAVVDFYAEWCGPCKKTAPILAQLANDYAGEIDFYKVDIDKEPELAEAFGIRSIPTFLFIPEDGSTPTMQLGAMQKPEFEQAIKTMLKADADK